MITLRIAQLVFDTEAEGPGRRFALWLQGCSIRCAGCNVPDMFSAEGGTGWRVDRLAARILATPEIEGITLLGGEPMEQALPAAALAREVRAAGLSVMVFSGYRIDELIPRPDAAELLIATDLLVDGRYQPDLPEPAGGRRWIGSRNQNMYFLTKRYAPDDPRLVAPDSVEVVLEPERVSDNDWPGSVAQLGRRA